MIEYVKRRRLKRRKLLEIVKTRFGENEVL